MERITTDVNDLSSEDINVMEERRVSMLNEAGIDERDVLDRAGESLNIWNGYFNENIVRGKDDVNFCIRDQWTAVERSEFTRLFKPAMTFNKVYDPVKKIAAEQRKNKPDLLVRSLTGKASQDQIDLRADLIRTISYQSQNDLVYQTAFKSALMLGFGAFQVKLDYETPKSFNQVVRYESINDPTQCSWDPSALKPHKGDGNYCSRNYLLSRDEFFATYPYVTNPIGFVNPNMLLDFQWNTKDTINICDYFVKEWYPLLIYKLSNGEVVTEDQWEQMKKQFAMQKEITGDSIARDIIEKSMPKIVNNRQTQDYRIMHYRLIQNQVLDFSEWPSKQLPIPFVDGDSYYIEGRQYTKSFIHEARDAQKCINYFGSEIASEIKNRRREQWIATPNNIIGYEQQWRNPELQMGALMAKPDPKTGQMPMKQQAWDVSPGIMANMQRSGQDLREVLGFSETEQLQSRDISGAAKRERKLEGSMSAYVYFDNLYQAVEQGGRIVNDLLNYIIGDDERHMMLSQKDGKAKQITINERMKDGSIKNDIGRGDFDVEIDTGPSFAIQKEVALEFLQSTLQAFPQSFPLVADLWAKNLDVQFMPQISERFQTLVPPEILAKEKGEPPPPPQPNPQAMLMQAELQSKQAEIQNKMAKLELEKEQNELDKAKLLLDAQKLQNESQLDVFNHQAELERSRITHGLTHSKQQNDHSREVAKILSDIYKHENPNKNPKSG